jgi:hypothetical protein
MVGDIKRALMTADEGPCRERRSWKRLRMLTSAQVTNEKKREGFISQALQTPLAATTNPAYRAALYQM